MPGAGKRMLAVLVAALALCAHPGPLLAQTIEDAERLYRSAVLDEALAAFEVLRARGGDDVHALASICLHIGVLRTGSGEPELAREAFLQLLAVQPETDLPEGLGPAVEQQFQRVREEAGARPLGVVLDLARPLRPGGQLEVRIGGSGAGARLVETTRLEVPEGSGRRSMGFPGPGPHVATVPRTGSGTVTLAVELRDRNGWRLGRAERGFLVPPVRTDERPAPPPRADSPGIATRWWFWAGVGSAVVAGVVTAIVVASSADGAVVGAPVLLP